MADQTVNGNGIKRGAENVLTYLVGAAIVALVLEIWNMNNTIIQMDSTFKIESAARAASATLQANAIIALQTSVISLSGSVGELSGRVKQFSIDQEHSNEKRR